MWLPPKPTLRVPLPSLPVLQIMRKKIERLQKKIAEHERQAGGTLADLEVGHHCVIPLFGWAAM
jgi:hypothetical protein